MSRIGNKIIPIIEGTEVIINEGEIILKGKLGEDKVTFDSRLLSVENKDGHIVVTRHNEQKHTKQLHGTTRALINNAMIGVNEGFKKILQLVGIGYRAEMKGTDLVLHIGYSHPITIKPMDGVTIKTIDTKEKEVVGAVEVSGIDKFKVGQTAALIREQRRPEPYLGKGIRYKGEFILRKEGKRAGKK